MYFQIIALFWMAAMAALLIIAIPYALIIMMIPGAQWLE